MGGMDAFVDVLRVASFSSISLGLTTLGFGGGIGGEGARRRPPALRFRRWRFPSFLSGLRFFLFCPVPRWPVTFATPFAWVASMFKILPDCMACWLGVCPSLPNLSPRLRRL